MPHRPASEPGGGGAIIKNLTPHPWTHFIIACIDRHNKGTEPKIRNFFLYPIQNFNLLLTSLCLN